MIVYAQYFSTRVVILPTAHNAPKEGTLRRHSPTWWPQSRPAQTLCAATSIAATLPYAGYARLFTATISGRGCTCWRCTRGSCSIPSSPSSSPRPASGPSSSPRGSSRAGATSRRHRPRSWINLTTAMGLLVGARSPLLLLVSVALATLPHGGQTHDLPHPPCALADPGPWAFQCALQGWEEPECLELSGCAWCDTSGYGGACVTARMAEIMEHLFGFGCSFSPSDLPSLDDLYGPSNMITAMTGRENSPPAANI